MCCTSDPFQNFSVHDLCLINSLFFSDTAPVPVGDQGPLDHPNYPAEFLFPHSFQYGVVGILKYDKFYVQICLCNHMSP